MHCISRQEHTYCRVIVARPIVVQPRQPIIVLPGKAFGGIDIPFEVARIAIGAEHLVAFDRGSSCGVGDVGENTAQRISEVEPRAIAIERAKQLSAQAVIVGVPLVGPCTAVDMLFQPEGIDRQGGATAVGGTPQHAITCDIVEVPFLIGCPRIPLGELVEVVVGERAGRAAEGAADHIAKGIVAAGIALPGLIGAGGTGGIQSGQLVWMAAVAVKILVLGAATCQRALPQLTQVRVDVGVAVAGPT